MRLFKSLIILLFSLCAMGLNAQISHGGYPMPDVLEGVSRLRRGGEEIVRMPRLDTAQWAGAQEQRSVRCGGERFAYTFPVDFTPVNSGITHYLSDGTQVWRLHIVSEGAYSLNIIFDEYELNGASQLFLYSPERSMVLGSFTAENNSPSGVLATAPVEGDEVVVELITPKGVENRLKLGSVNHDYKGLRKMPAWGAAQPCEIDACSVGGHELQMRSSVLYIVDGAEFCSGNMVNNTRNDCTPYMITSSHCLFDYRDNFIAEKAVRSVFFFDYDNPHCWDHAKGTLEMSVAGAEVAFSNLSSDALLLRLNDRPPLDYKVYYAGWNATDQVSAPFYCLHHPGSDVLKISVEQDEVVLGSFDYLGLFEANKHWVVDRWEMGIMEGGSSGSALFDSGDKVVGALSGGDTKESCSWPGYDAFWSLHETWNAGLGKLLDPDGTGSLHCEGMEANAQPCRRITNWTSEDTIHTMIPNEQNAAGHNWKGIDEYSERFRLGAEKSVLYGFHFMTYQGSYEADHPIYVRVYGGDSVPMELKLEEPLVTLSYEYKRREQVPNSVETKDWALRDCYYRFEQPIMVDSIFFIALKLDNASTQSVAFVHTEVREDKSNSAFFRGEFGWQSFEANHPYYPYPTSLYIEPEMQLGSSVIYAPVYEAEHPMSFLLSNPVENRLSVRLPAQAKLQSYELRTLRGDRVETKNVSTEEDYLSLDIKGASGIYILRLIFDSHVESIKVMKR